MLNNLLAFTRDDITNIQTQIGNAGGAKGFTKIGDLFGAGGGGLGLNTIFFFIAGALLLLYLIYGGISLMTSQGDPKAVAGAKQTITNALIGMIIVFAAYWIVQIVGLILGLKAFENIF